MIKRIAVVFALLVAVLCLTADAQVAVYTSTAQDAGSGKRISAPTVKVCPYDVAHPTFCTSTSTLYKDRNLTALSNPFTGDASGNYEFWATPGDYTVQVSKAGFSSYTYHVSVGPSLAGDNAFTGSVSFKKQNDIRYADQFPGADIGAKVNAALADLPAAGGTVYLPIGTSAFTTPIVIAKPVVLSGHGAYATVLNYTAASGDAITVNVPVASSISYSASLRQFQLLGPSSGTSRGLVINSANRGQFVDLTVFHFGGDGIVVDTSAAGENDNANSMVFGSVKSQWNGGNGFTLTPVATTPGDSNLISFLGVTASANTGDGFNVASSWNVFSACDASNNVGYGANFVSTASENHGSIYVELNTAGGVNFASGALGNRIELIDALGATATVTDAGTGNSYLRYKASGIESGYGWYNLPVISIRGSNPWVKNTSDSDFSLNLQGGINGSTARAARLKFWDNSASPVEQWKLEKATNGTFSIIHTTTGATVFTTGSETDIESEGTQPVKINNLANSGTGGVAFYSGGASPSQVASVSSGGVGAFLGLKSGASGSTISDTRELVQSAHSCGTTTTCANTANASNRVIFGSAALSSASPSTAVITGISPAFTSTASFFCTATNATTQANAVKVTNTSTSSITLTGPNTVTDTVNYICVGN